MTRRWTPGDDARLRELYPVTRTSELPALFGRSKLAIKVRAAAMHLRKDPEVSMRRQWHPDEDAVLRMLYADTPTDGIAAVLGRSLSTTYRRARKLGLEKSEEYLLSPDACRLRRGDNVGAAYRFQKGHAPANKGLRRPGWSVGRMKETQFRKGERRGVAVRLYKAIGTERVSKDGYLERKVNDDLPLQRRWRAVHLLMWESVHGPLPPGHAVVFKNGDKKDIRIDNLECITRQELMARNTIHRYPQEIVHATMLIGAVKQKINRRLRSEEQDRRSA